ncbi:unknown [Haloarcula marismortui ATCC 43049]|uniref:Uncharacterized protein n=1 Tax=Haloarcula marismortui (strain ATCC 43049 / DSM 3752 / JCM 8966 / VKM B-1809) TaxID=272569 RepID=Q5V0V9_HALMA|nr:unknown [Haloarcula marismortui ATCC 43049]
MSPPAENDSPVPSMTTHRTPDAVSMVSRWRSKASYTGCVSAFRVSGSFSVSVAMPSVMESSTDSLTGYHSVVAAWGRFTWFRYKFTAGSQFQTALATNCGWHVEGYHSEQG